MRGVTWRFSFLIMVMGTVAADRPDPAAKKTTAATQVKAAPGAPAKPGAAVGQPKSKSALDPRRHITVSFGPEP